MTLDFRKIVIANVVFCYLPVVLFLAGWCRWEIAIPSCLLLGYLLYRVYTRTIRTAEECCLSIRPSVLAALVTASFILAVLFGYGGFFASFFDYEKHSMIVQDLSRYSWPVIYSDAESPSLLTYYVGSYLFPGLVGKIFGSRIVAEICLGIVGWLGMMLLFVNILFLVDAQTAKKQIWALVIYLGFCGMLLPLQLLTFSFHEDVYLGDPQWFIFRWLQYRSSIVSLKWVWEQYTIPVLCLSMLYHYRAQRKLYAVWILPALICGTWCFVTLIVYVVGEYILSCNQDKKIHWDVLSWQNIFCALIGVIMVLYFSGSLSTEKPDELRFHFITDWKYYLLSYIPFCFFMFGCYFMLIWKETQKDHFFYITMVLLCLIPIARAGYFNDWCMGTSMPALFLLTIYCIRYLLNKPTDKVYKRKWITLIVCLSINVHYVLKEFTHPLQYGGLPARSMRVYSCEGCEEIDEVMRTNYFSYSYEESMFYNYIARK